MFDTCSFKPTNDGFPPSSGGGGGAVDSVFGRTGVVIAQASDYSAFYLSNTLANTQIFVGNGSNVATAVAMSGDATISNTGVVTLANSGVSASTYGSATQVPVFAVDSKGRITSVTNTTITGFVSDTLTSANIIVGNGSNVATAVAMSGDATISNTGAVTLANTTVVASTYGSATQVPVFAVDSKGRITSVTNTTITGFVSDTLTSANIIVGNGSNVATAVAMSGDITINNAGATTIGNDKVLTANILNSNVTYAKIQNVSTNDRLLGRATAGAGVIEELALGTNLSITGTTLNASGGGYNYLAITLSADTTYNKAALGGANYLVVSTNDSNSRILTIGTGFSATDQLIINFPKTNLGLIQLTIDSTNYIANRGCTYIATFNGTNWILSSANNFIQDNATNVSFGKSINNPSSGIMFGTSLSSTTGGLLYGYTLTASGSDSIIIGRNISLNNGSNIAIGMGSTLTAISDTVAIGSTLTSNAGTSVIIGNSTTASGANSVVIGRGNNTSTNTGVVAIGQGITLTAQDAVIIGRAAGASGGSNIVSIGAATTGTGFSVVRVGAGINTGASTNLVAIGNGANAGGNTVSIGSATQGTGNNCVIIGEGSNIGANTGVVAIGQNIFTTNTDAVVIGRAASAGGTANVTIGGSATGTGANCVRIGNGVATSTNTGVVAIGQGITTTAQDAVVIGRAASGGSGAVVVGQAAVGTANSAISVGQGASVTNGLGIAIGNVANTNQNYSLCLGYAATSTSELRQIAFGALSFPRHYGAVSRRIDTNTSLLDADTPARHSDNSSWNVTTTDATPTTMTLYGVANKRLTLQDNEALHFDVYITAKQNGSTNTLIRRIAGGAVRGGGAGTTSIVGQTTLYTHGTALTTTLSADTTNGAVQLQVTGDANTWQWTAYVEYQRTRTA